MYADNIPVPDDEEIIVIYSTVGGLPYVNAVTRDRAIAAAAYNDVLISNGQHMTAAEAAEGRAANPSFADEMEEIAGEHYLAHTSEFDVFVEVVEIRNRLDVEAPTS